MTAPATRPATTLSRPSSRLVWSWCVAYTAVTPRWARERRRDEIRSHLWESERASLPSRAVAFAALRGALQDLLWAAGRGIPHLGRSFRTPTPYVVLAPLFPMQAWFVSALTVGGTAHVAEALGGIGGGALLAAAGAAWLLQRRRDS